MKIFLRFFFKVSNFDNSCKNAIKLFPPTWPTSVGGRGIGRSVWLTTLTTLFQKVSYASYVNEIIGII